MNNALPWYRRCLKQEFLYILFILSFLIPNIVLFITEPQPVCVALASILLPLSLWMALLLVFRKPGIMAWVLFPKIILDGGQLVLLCLFGESVIAVDMFLNLTSSNSSEAGELLSNIIFTISGVFFFYILPTSLFAWRSVRMKEKLSGAFRRKGWWYSLAVLIVGLLFVVLSIVRDERFSLKDDVYPVNALYNLYFAINKAERSSAYATTSAHFTFGATKEFASEHPREIYVLVVGETSRAMEWSLYGYDRKTTPRMEALDGLVWYRDAVTQSNNTHKSVPIILSAASAEDYDRIYYEKSILTAFKESGFRTVAIINQKLTSSMIGMFYHEADTLINMSEEKTVVSPYDGCILPSLQKIMNETDDDLFIVLHTYGSHFNYHERYPRDFAIYTPDKADRIKASARKELHNAYDNTICYTDYVLGEIVAQLQHTQACTVMLYVSDHGEDIFDDSRERYLHASPIPTYYQLHIPYAIWFSDQYKDCYPDKYDNAGNHRNLPVSTNSVFHTMLDLACIRSTVLNTSLALTNPAFKIMDRMYLDDHDEPVSFWEVGLKKADFAMLDKWDITYRKEE